MKQFAFILVNVLYVIKFLSASEAPPLKEKLSHTLPAD